LSLDYRTIWRHEGALQQLGGIDAMGIVSGKKEIKKGILAEARTSKSTGIGS
jgi:hypothetical protein